MLRIGSGGGAKASVREREPGAPGDFPTSLAAKQSIPGTQKTTKTRGSGILVERPSLRGIRILMFMLSLWGPKYQ